MNESHFKILRTYPGKFDCLVFEMLNIKKSKRNPYAETFCLAYNFCNCFLSLFMQFDVMVT